MIDIKNQNEQINRSTQQDDTIQIYLSDIWRGITKFWWLVLLLAALVGGIMFARSYTSYSPKYKASATFTVQTRNISDSTDDSYAYVYNRSTASLLSQTFPYILQSNLLQEAVCQDLGYEKLPVTISASAVADTNMFTLTTIGDDPQEVYEILLSVIDNYPVVAEYVIGNTELNMILVPTMPEEPYNKFAYRNSTAKGLLIGAVIGAAWILLYAILRKTIRKKTDIPMQLNQNCLGALPDVYFKRYKRKIDKTVVWTNSRIGSGFLESARLLRNAVTHACEQEKVIMITSTSAGEGKSTVAVNLAIGIAKSEKKALLIDGDVRNSGINEIMKLNKGTDAKTAKSRVLNADKEGQINGYKIVSSNEYYTILDIAEMGIHLLTFNMPNKQFFNIIKADNLERELKPLKEKYDFIIVDTPPIGLMADASVIAGVCDAAIYVIKQDGIRVSRIRSSMEELLTSEIKVLGCVLNGASSGISGYGDNYGYSRYGSKYNSYGYGYDYGYKK